MKSDHPEASALRAIAVAGVLICIGLLAVGFIIVRQFDTIIDDLSQVQSRQAANTDRLEATLLALRPGLVRYDPEPFEAVNVGRRSLNYDTEICFPGYVDEVVLINSGSWRFVGDTPPQASTDEYRTLNERRFGSAEQGEGQIPLGVIEGEKCARFDEITIAFPEALVDDLDAHPGWEPQMVIEVIVEPTAIVGANELPGDIRSVTSLPFTIPNE